MLIINNLDGVVVCGRDVDNAKKKNPLISFIATDQSMMVDRPNVLFVRRNTTTTLGIRKTKNTSLKRIERGNTR
jgi:hypothetical protein